MRRLRKLKPDFFLIFLILIAVFLCYTNYTPETFLSGWDTLHPEFNLKLYWQRITSVWQEHQGLGAPPSQAHAAEIPRLIILVIFSLIFPQNFVRYAYFFLMIVLGPVGVYLFLKKSLGLRPQNDKYCRHPFNYLTYDRDQDNNQTVNQIASFLSGLFYLLNLGTMQHFIVPLEMFATQFGFLGFLYLFAVKFLNEGKKKNLIIFSLLTIFASPMAHTATLWYVYFSGLVLFLITYSFLNSNLFKKSLLLITLTLLLNLYWILPNLYYVANHGKDVINSKIHRLGTEEFYYHNKKYGKISNLLLFKNFLFDWYITNNNGKSQPLLISWSEHLKNSNILMIGYFLSLLSLVGLIFARRKKNTILLSFLPIFLFSSFFLLSATPGISIIFEWLRSTTPLIKEVFRFPFTKFSIYLIFCFSLFFGYFHHLFLSKFSSILSKNYLNFFTFLYFYFFIFLNIIFILPAFSGNFISPIVRVKIPQEYFSLFNWSKKQDKGRILLLPIHDPYGWAIYRWDLPTGPQIYQGAGFTWFGLNQPSLNSEFNRWYPQNEQAFREFFYAVYSQNGELFEKLLLKYNIQYILLDENVIIPGDENQEKKLFYPEIKALLANLPTIKLTQKFGKKISLFEFLPNQRKKPIEILTDYKVIEPSYRWNYVDEAYQQHGNYITYLKRPQPIIDYIYPGRNILTEQEKINQKILTIGENSYQINFSKTSLLENGGIKIPSLSTTESEFYTEVYAKKKGEKIIVNLKYLLPYITSDQVYTQEFELPLRNSGFFSLNDKIFPLPTYLSENPTYLGEEILFTQKENRLGFYNNKPIPLTLTNFTTIYPYLCSTPQENQIFGAETTANGFKIYGQKAKVCLSLPLKELVSLKKEGALRIKFNYQIKEGGKADLCLFDDLKNKCLFTKNLKPSFSPQVDFFLPINHVNSNSLHLNFSFDTQEDTVIRELLIKDLNFDFYEEEDKKSFLAEIPPFKTTTKEFKLEGKFPQEKVNLTAENIGMEKNDCSFEKAKFIDKQFIEDGRDVILEYKAKDGAICDSIPLLNLSKNMGYLLSIESQNVSGLPLKICLKNAKSEICDLEERLSKNKKMAIDYFLIPPYHNGYGYYLLLNNYSIGEVLTINRIKSIRLIPFPYNFFQSIKWQNKNNEIIPMNQSIKIEINKNLPYLYKAEISSPPPPTHYLIVLNQAFEKNWKAYFSETCNVKSITCKIKNIFNLFFPFIFGKEIKEHVLVNNWANGFILPSNTKLLTSNTNKFNIIIVFLPQYLEFLGFLMMGVGFLIVIKIKHQESHLD
jgi:hypothetical protein